jgi:hypothetical protein
MPSAVNTSGVAAWFGRGAQRQVVALAVPTDPMPAIATTRLRETYLNV